MTASDSIVVLNRDSRCAGPLAAELNRRFVRVRTASSVAELEALLNEERFTIAVLDLEGVSLHEIVVLQHRFGLQVIYTHRLPDEAMWACALGAGAVDCFYSDDIRAIVAAAAALVGVMG